MILFYRVGLLQAKHGDVEFKLNSVSNYVMTRKLCVYNTAETCSEPYNYNYLFFFFMKRQKESLYY